MSGDWTLLTKAAAELFLTEADRNTWHALSAKARNRLALADAEITELAELNHQLGAVIRFKFREGRWQFGYLESDRTTFGLVPDIWRRLPLHIDPFGASLTWDGKTFFPVLVRDTGATTAESVSTVRHQSAIPNRRQRKKKAPKKPGGLNFGESDAVLVRRMRDGILKGAKNGGFRGQWDAARALAHLAEGTGTLASKEIRLSGKYTKAYLQNT